MLNIIKIGILLVIIISTQHISSVFAQNKSGENQNNKEHAPFITPYEKIKSPTPAKKVSPSQKKGTGLTIRNEENWTTRAQTPDAKGANARLQIKITEENINALVNSQTVKNGSYGNALLKISRSQSTVQQNIDMNIYKLDGKNKYLRFLTGSDYRALNELKTDAKESSDNLSQILAILNSSDSKDREVVKNLAVSLINQNTAISNRINSENGSFSIFGWLFKFFTQ
ncbi:MAG: hypothetical protein L0Y76_10100 [Ignavibacteria bacterium]|nr:hypothetical protein [Ignavibacteria bacterium]